MLRASLAAHPAGDVLSRVISAQLLESVLDPAGTPGMDATSGGDSMAARLARQRQQRSVLRTSNLPLDDAGPSAPSAVVGSELSILRAEVADSGQTISRLQTQLKQSEAEMEAMGQTTERLTEELRSMREQAAAATATAPSPAAALSVDGVADDAPMSVSIDFDGDGTSAENLSVSVSIKTS